MRKRSVPPTPELVAGIRGGDRAVLGQAITLVESNARAHQQQAQDLLQALTPTAESTGALRLGITGVPGAGKSTFIEAFGTWLVEQGHRVAVTAVDPTSTLSGGSILGDKTRMETLSRDARAFIRPSPSGGTLGGVARKTRETILLFEAAGYDVVLVETVGVGQSESAVRAMVDFFVILLIPGAGDELQGIKKGVIELVDAVLVNKADGDNLAAAKLAHAEYDRALHWLRPATEGWSTRAHLASALTGAGVTEFWSAVEKFRAITTANGALQRRRRDQSRDWMLSLVEERVRARFFENPAVAAALPELQRQVMAGELPPTRAAWELLAQVDQGDSG